MAILDQSQLIYNWSGGSTQGFGSYYRGQTFTVGISGDLEKVAVWIHKAGTPPNPLVVEIFATSAGLPTGVALASEEIAEVSVNQDAETEITFSSPTTLVSGTMYVIVLRQKNDGGDISNAYQWKGSSTNVYADGTTVEFWGSFWQIAYSDMYFKTYVEGVPTIKTISADTEIVSSRVNKTIQSDAFIISENNRIINSNTVIKTQNPETIFSDAKVVDRTQKDILSDTVILELTHSETIQSDAYIAGQIQQEINSDVVIMPREWQDIFSDTVIWAHQDFYCKLRAQVETQSDFHTQLKVNQPTPTNVSNLTAEDPETGEAITLDWDDDSNYGYNVYKDVGGSWVKQNGIIITDSNYVVGSLTTGVTYTFKVKSLNGVGTESTGVTITGTTLPNDTTPTYNVERYTNPSYEIKIDNEIQTDAVLSRVELIYGTSFSTAEFYIPKSPVTVGLPEATRQEVKVYINDRLVLKGKLIRRENSYDAKELRVSYTVINSLWNETLSCIGINATRPKNYPESLWNPLQVADLTQLEYRNFVIRYRGNYKVYCSPTGDISYYKVGNPVSSRVYEIGKHIIKQNMSTDWSNPPKQVTIYSDHKQITVSTGWSSDGNEMKVSGNEISNVQVFAKINTKPEVTGYLRDIDVLPGHITETFGTAKWTIPSISDATKSTSAEATTSALNTWHDGGSEARHPIQSYRYFPTTWQPISVNIEYADSGDNATIKLSSYPKAWHKNIDSGDAEFKISDKDGNITDSSLYVKIWNEPYWSKAPIKVVYTYKGERMSSIAGSGIATRQIHESVVPISISVSNELPYQYRSQSNYSDISSYLNTRALGEAGRQSQGTTKGTLTILGDETLDLRTQVNGYEVVRITHDFNNSFLTHIDLTDESFYRGIAMFERKEMLRRKDEGSQNSSRLEVYNYDMQKVKAITGSLNIDNGVNPKGGAAYYSD